LRRLPLLRNIVSVLIIRATEPLNGIAKSVEKYGLTTIKRRKKWLSKAISSEN
jgi:hypothetical protein